MADSITDTDDTPLEAATETASTRAAAKQRFSKAIDEAKSGTQLIAQDAKQRASAYGEKVADMSSEWVDEAKAKGNEAKDKAYTLANEGKARASEAISGLGKMVEQNAATIDEKIGGKYGDYARTAARTLQETAERIDAKDVGELGEDAKEFVRKSPGVSVAIAAAAGFLIARLFKKSGG